MSSSIAYNKTSKCCCCRANRQHDILVRSGVAVPMSYDDDDVTVRAVVAYTYFSVSIKKQKHGVETNNKNKSRIYKHDYAF